MRALLDPCKQHLGNQPEFNRRQFQAVVLGGLFLATGYTQSSGATRPPNDTAQLVKANNAFALTLLRELDARDKGANHFLSPFSLQSALTMATEGARGETATEMGRTLQFPEAMRQAGIIPWDMTRLRREFQSISDRMQPDNSEKANILRKQVSDLRSRLTQANEEAHSLRQAKKFQQADAKSAEAVKLANQINALAAQVDQYELSNANSLWIDNSFTISPHYQSIVREFYRPAEVAAANFRHQSDEERLRINQWVSEQTHAKIRDIVPPGVINPLTRLVIANAIYFKGTWAAPFNAEFTQTAPFVTSDSKKISAPLMNANNFKVGRYAAFNADGSPFATPNVVDRKLGENNGYPTEGGYQVVELPYSGETVSMMVFLPIRPDGLDTLLSTLSVTQIDTCVAQLKPREFHLTLPKFKLDANYGLVEPLEKLGMRRAFSEHEADFSGLTEKRDPNHQLYITGVLHKAFVEVNEQGTEAAAATVVTFAPRAALMDQPFIPRFKADHPFLFAIRDRASGLILFIGKVEKPSA